MCSSAYAGRKRVGKMSVIKFNVNTLYEVPVSLLTSDVLEFQSVLNFAARLIDLQKSLSDEFVKSTVYQDYMKTIEGKHAEELSLVEKSASENFSRRLSDIIQTITDKQQAFNDQIDTVRSEYDTQIKAIQKVRRIARRFLIFTKIYIVFDFGAEIDSTSSLNKLNENSTRRTFILKGNMQSSTIVEEALHLGAKEIRSIYPPTRISNSEKPIVVHIRLTDYMAQFGSSVIPPAYYINGLNFVVNEFPDSPIWLFSDDPESALEFFPDEFTNKLDFVNDPRKNSDWDELQLMSQGCAFVIPNSTFGYWAASLSKASLVVCPSPWLKDYPSPSENFYFDFPIHWTQLAW